MMSEKRPLLCAEKLMKISLERLPFSEVITHNSLEVFCMYVEVFTSSSWTSWCCSLKSPPVKSREYLEFQLEKVFPCTNVKRLKTSCV